MTCLFSTSISVYWRYFFCSVGHGQLHLAERNGWSLKDEWTSILQVIGKICEGMSICEGMMTNLWLLSDKQYVRIISTIEYNYKIFTTGTTTTTLWPGVPQQHFHFIFTLPRLQQIATLITMALFKILTLATIAAATGSYTSTKVASVVSDRSLQDAVSCIAWVFFSFISTADC